MRQTLLLLSLLVSAASGFLDDSDDCVIQPSPQGAKANPKCTEGLVMWGNPRGEVDVTFDPEMFPEFRLCLHVIESMACQALFQVTPEGDINITRKDQEKDMCAGSIDGKVVIKFAAPVGTPYVTMYEYRIDG